MHQVQLGASAEIERTVLGSMLEVHLERLGPPSVVAKCRKSATPPAPSAWEALVKIEAFPINPADLAMISGRYGILPKPPCGIGMEAVGRVEKLGDSVEGLQIGDRVLVIANNNWAQYRTVPANLLQLVPESLDPLLVANMKVNAATAYKLLKDSAPLKPGSWIAQNAPLSDVGQRIIQFAKLLGFKTLNLVRRPEAVAEVLELGGDAAVEVRGDDEDLPERLQEAVGRSKISLGLDAVAGNATETLARCCSDKAHVVTYGMLSGEPSAIRAEHIVFRGLEHRGFWLSKLLNRFSHAERTRLYEEIAELLKKTPPRLNFAYWASMEQIGEAIRQVEAGAGRVVVFPHGKPEASKLSEGLEALPEPQEAHA